MRKKFTRVLFATALSAFLLTGYGDIMPAHGSIGENELEASVLV